MRLLERRHSETPLVYFLFDTDQKKKNSVADKPETIEHLKANITNAIAEVRPQSIEKVNETWSHRKWYCAASRHMSEMI